MQLRMKLAAAAVAGSAAALSLAAMPGAASAQVTRPHRTVGRLVAVGGVRGRDAVIVEASGRALRPGPHARHHRHRGLEEPDAPDLDPRGQADGPRDVAAPEVQGA
jgi:hypothetical protein